MTDADIIQADLRELLSILGMPDHARPQSPHEVFQEALAILKERLKHAPAPAGTSAPAPQDYDPRAVAAAFDRGLDASVRRLGEMAGRR